MERRDFLITMGTAAGASLINPYSLFAATNGTPQKRRLARVGTGIRGISLWAGGLQLQNLANMH